MDLGLPLGPRPSNVGELQYYAPDAFNLNSGKLDIIAQPTPNRSIPTTPG